MKKLSSLALISAFFILSAFSCEKNLELAREDTEFDEPICNTESKIRENVKGVVSWSKSVNDWVLWINAENPEKSGKNNGLAYFDCSGMPDELMLEGIEVRCDLEIKIYPNAGAIKIPAQPMEVLSFEILKIPDENN